MKHLEQLARKHTVCQGFRAGIMVNNMEITIVYRVSYRDFIGIMEKNMETT